MIKYEGRVLELERVISFQIQPKSLVDSIDEELPNETKIHPWSLSIERASIRKRNYRKKQKNDK